ncbi:MAG TPA: POTRA domain-containing protein [Pyrinomonadaceae bacterium]|nr:POTRA domain-containing protein [Pyrinomonadaceae bacterium]
MLIFLLLVIALFLTTPTAAVSLVPALSYREPFYWSSPCSQPAAGRTTLMREAERQKNTVSRVEFIGNEHVRDSVLRRRVLLNEGDLFKTRRVLNSIAGLNALRTINPVKLADITIQLDKDDKTVNMLICFHERHRW